jgi:hypothetical protein
LFGSGSKFVFQNLLQIFDLQPTDWNTLVSKFVIGSQVD